MNLIIINGYNHEGLKFLIKRLDGMSRIMNIMAPENTHSSLYVVHESLRPIVACLCQFVRLPVPKINSMFRLKEDLLILKEKVDESVFCLFADEETKVTMWQDAQKLS